VQSSPQIVGAGSHFGLDPTQFNS